MKREIMLINARLVTKKDNTSSTIITYQCSTQGVSEKFKGNLVFEEWLDGNVIDKFKNEHFNKPFQADFTIVPGFNGRQKIVLSSIQGIF